MGKAKQKQIQETNLKRREKTSRERIKIGTLPPPLLFGFSPFSPFLIGWRPCGRDRCVVLYQMVEGGGEGLSVFEGKERVEHFDFKI